MKKIKIIICKFLLKFFEKDIIACLSPKSIKELKKSGNKFFKKIVIKCANNYNRNTILDFQMRSWRNLLFLNDIPNYKENKDIGKIFGEKSWIKNEIECFFNLKSCGIMNKNNSSYFVIYSNPKIRTVIDVFTVKLLVEYIIANKIKIHDQKCIQKLCKKFQDEVKITIVNWGNEFLTKYLEYNNPHPDLSYMVGNLIFCKSYDQNLFLHSYEVAELSKLFFQELGFCKNDQLKAKRAAFFHDIGKVSGKEIDHVSSGKKIAKNFGLDKYIYKTIEFSHLSNYNKAYANEFYQSIMSRFFDKFSACNHRTIDESYIKKMNHFIKKRLEVLEWVESCKVVVLNSVLDIVIKNKNQQLKTNFQYENEVRQIIANLRCEKDFVREFNCSFFLNGQKKYSFKIDPSNL